VIRLTRSLAAWGTASFDQCFKAEVEGLGAAQLPLQQGLSLSSCVSDEPFKVMLISASEEPTHLRVRAGVFYSGVVSGCNCSDDQSPMEVQPEYCELEFVIARDGAEATVRLLPA